jgi:hypothetical protein
VLPDAQAAPGAREEREMMAYENQALWTILEYLNKALTPDQLLENAQLATNLAGFCSALVDQVELQAFPAGKYKVFKFVMKYLRHITAQPSGMFTTHTTHTTHDTRRNARHTTHDARETNLSTR